MKSKPWHEWAAVGAAFKDEPCQYCAKGNKKGKFRVFYWDGAPYSSRSMGPACGKHLPLLLRKAWKENKKDNVGWAKPEYKLVRQN